MKKISFFEVLDYITVFLLIPAHFGFIAAGLSNFLLPKLSNIELKPSGLILIGITGAIFVILRVRTVIYSPVVEGVCIILTVIHLLVFFWTIANLENQWKIYVLLSESSLAFAFGSLSVRIKKVKVFREQ